MKKIIIVHILFLSFGLHAQNQDKVLSFFGTGRAWIENDHLSGKLIADDTTNPSRASLGHALFDLGINITPVSSIQINSILRAKNEFGGFYGSGARVSIRQLYVSGSIGKKFNYQVGDLDLKQSKYTLWNYEEEGQVNEGSVFSIPRSIVHYENFYTDKNTWRMQGFSGEIDFSLGKFVESVEAKGFMTRIRQAGFTIPAGSEPEKLMGGLSLTFLKNDKVHAGLNYANVFEVPSTSSNETGMEDQVGTVNAKFTVPVSSLKLSFYSEAGLSKLKYKNQPLAPAERIGNVFDGGIKLGNDIFSAGVSYRYVSHDFISPGAQTKRIAYGLNPFLFPYLGNSSVNRAISLWDLSRDISLYNRSITEIWMTYRPAYANALPYGDATPNRKGILTEIKIKDNKNLTETRVSSALLSDVVGQGTEAHKNYTLITAESDIHLNKLIRSDKKIKVSLGWKMDHAYRKGDTIVAIDYHTSLLDIGLDVEVVKQFEILLGIKRVSANGKEFIPAKNEYNVISDYVRINEKLSETIFAFGFSYRFTEDIYFTIQNHYFKGREDKSNLKYGINQVFFLFNARF